MTMTKQPLREASKDFTSRQSRNQKIWFAVLAAACLIIGIALAISFDSNPAVNNQPPPNQQQSSASSSSSANDNNEVTSTTTPDEPSDPVADTETTTTEAEAAPTTTTTEAATTATTTTTDAPTPSLLDILLASFPDSTQQAISTPKTPQSKAFDWLSKHPNLATIIEEGTRTKQLMALATIFFALQGDRIWPVPVQEDWLQYVSECVWGRSVHHSSQLVHCNENNQVDTLFIEELEAPGDNSNNMSKPFFHLPPEIAFLSQLSVLSMSNNEFVNTPLHEFLPTELFEMDNLAELKLYRSKLSGSIPSQVGLLRGLKTLLLWANPLVGTIPPSLGRLSDTLKTLDLSHTMFSGMIPTQLGLLSDQLSYLRLHENPKLVGPIPSELGQLTQLTDLYLRKNSQLTGTLPTQLGLLRNMVRLNLGKCSGLSGTIPTEYGALTKMGDRSIWLEGNNLVGTIPTEVGMWTNLGLFLLNHNDLSGTMPTQIGRMKGLEEISLYYNNLQGPIPSQLGSLSSTQMGLTRIYLYNNDLTGTIPKQLSGLWANGTGTLEGLRVQNNPNLMGTIPEELCGMGQVKNADDWWEHGLLFDCNDNLCGCSWCPCFK